MLWREHYETRILEGVELPGWEGLTLENHPLEYRAGLAVVMGFSLNSMRQRELWRRLLEAEWNGPYVIGVVLPRWTPAKLEEFRASLPRSQWPTTAAWTDPEELWKAALQPESADRVCTVLLTQEKTHPVWVGPPTEEAWDAFLLRGSRLRDQSSRE